MAVWRCMALYCCIAIQWARDRVSWLYCPIQQVFLVYCCRAGCIGWPAVLGGQGWPDDLVGASLSLAMLSWVPLTVCDVCSVTLTHPCSHVTMTTIGFVRRHSAHTAVLLYCGLYCNTAQNLLYWAIQHSRPVPRPWQYSNTAPYSAIQLYSNTSQYSIQHNTLPLRYIVHLFIVPPDQALHSGGGAWLALPVTGPALTS